MEIGMDNESQLATDILVGAEEIADFLGWKPRRVRYLAEQGELPVFRVGHGQTLHARKSTLTRWIVDLDNAALQAVQAGA
jgi:phage terminase Nu1 subunit (DNA packaging protein)